MVATLQLGYSHIWIDSLCIVQDSEDDWNSEASRMGDYYSHSICNLAAASGVDCHSGLFAGRSQFASTSCIVDERWTNTWPQFVFRIDESKGQFNLATKQSKLGERGWIQQELMLAPRTLYFGVDEIFFECRAFLVAESAPSHEVISEIILPETFPDWYSEEDLRGITRPLPSWTAIVESYSLRKLTYPVKDKLAAIGGLARRHGNFTDYLAGLWRSKLPDQLLWMSNGAKRERNYVAPTWSWASMDGYINFEEILEGDILDENFLDVVGGGISQMALQAGLEWRSEIYISIIEAYTVARGPDPFGALKGGHLRLQGYPFRITASTYIIPLSPESIELNLHLDDWAASWYLASNKDFVCLPVRNDTLSRLLGLLLQPTSDGNGEFERVGKFSVGGKEKDFIPSFEVLAASCSGIVMPLRACDYEQKTGKVREGMQECVVSIV